MYHVETPSAFIGPLTLYGHAYREFPVNFPLNLRDLSKGGRGAIVHGGQSACYTGHFRMNPVNLDGDHPGSVTNVPAAREPPPPPESLALRRDYFPSSRQSCRIQNYFRQHHHYSSENGCPWKRVADQNCFFVSEPNHQLKNCFDEPFIYFNAFAFTLY